MSACVCLSGAYLSLELPQSSSSWRCFFCWRACIASMCTRTSRRAPTAPTSPNTWSRPAAPGPSRRPSDEKRRSCLKLTKNSGAAKLINHTHGTNGTVTFGKDLHNYIHVFDSFDSIGSPLRGMTCGFSYDHSS